MAANAGPVGRRQRNSNLPRRRFHVGAGGANAW